HRRRYPAGGVSDGAAGVVPADDHALGIHFSNRQHAARTAADHVRGAGAVFLDGAARHRVEGNAPVAPGGAGGRAWHVCAAGAAARVTAARPGARLMRRLRVLVWKEFLELRLNPRLFGLVVIAPILQLTML